MATAAQMTDLDIPMIEEQVDTGLQQLLDSYKPAYVPGGDKDALADRFTLYPNRPLPEFDNAYAKAFEARDDFNTARITYAMVCDSNMPVRLLAAQELVSLVNPHIVTLLGYGTVNCSHLGESRTVLFFERPRGQRLSELTKQGARLHEHKVIDYVLQPAVKALTAMYEKKICHGHIHPHNFFLGDIPQMGECISAPCGTLSHYLYEPIERLMAQPLGRGEANEKSDIYSLAILAYDLMYGLDKIKALTKEAFIERAINLGTYTVFANGREFSDMFQDFFRGILNENPAERWGLEQVQNWLGGKRFNMIAPSAPKEASRPIEFAGQQIFSRRLLAHFLHTRWRESLKEIKNLRIDRWCEMSLHRPELAEKLDRSLRVAGHGSTDVQLNDMLTRVITILDPTGPLRSRELSLRPDGIGPILADVVHHNSPEYSQLANFIENDLGNFWTEQAESNKNADISVAVWRLQRTRPYLKSKALGFGLERTLYELNPSMCCQSPLVKQYHVMTSGDMLRTLDALASQLGPDTNLVDRHIAAFIANRIEMGKEIRLNELSEVPMLADNQELLMLKILAKAQQKHTRLQLVGLCTWAAMRVEKLVDQVHNRIIRKRLKLALKKYAQTGNLFEVMAAIVNSDVTFHDPDGFAKAIALHQINQDRIDRLRNEEILEYRARKAGGKMAMVISWIALAITSYITLTDTFTL